MKTISIFSYNTTSIGIKVIVDAMFKTLNKKYNVKIVRNNSDLRKEDLVIPYGPKETFYALRNGYNVPFSLMVDYYSLSLKNTALFLIKEGYLFKKPVLKSILAYFYYYLVEIYICRKCKNMMFVSQTDINKLIKRFPHNNFYCVPNGVSLPDVTLLSKRNNTKKISFGILSVWNQSAFLEIKWFVDRVWPKILKKYPDVEIVICGKYATEDMKNYFNSQSNVRFIGEVDDLSTFFNQINIYLATKTIGVGILNKVLDAMAYKKLVIGVKESFTGFSYMKDSYIICKEPDDYIQILKQYYEDPNQYDVFIENAYNNIIQYNNWESNYKKFMDKLIEEKILF